MIDFVAIGAVIADIVLIALFVASVANGSKNGLVRVIFSFVCLIITFVALLIFSRPITSLIYEKTHIDESISNGINKALGGFFEDQIEKYGKIDTSKTNMSKPIANHINKLILSQEETSAKKISKIISDELSYYILSAVVIILLFIAVRIATMFLNGILQFLTDLPIIKQFDELGGVLYGIIRGFLLIYLILAIISLLSPLLTNTFVIAAINNSRICSKFYNKNVFLNLLIK